MTSHRVRLAGVRRKLRLGPKDLFLSTGRDNVSYLSGFTGSSGVLVVSRDGAFLLTDFRYWEQAALEVRDVEIVKASRRLIDFLGRFLVRIGVQRLFFESVNTSYKQYCTLESALRGRELAPAENVVESLRQRKDTEELLNVGKAVQVSDDCFRHVLEFLKPGVAELDVAAEISHFTRLATGTDCPFEPIVACGARGALPHARATGACLVAGEPIVIDIGARWQGYCSDLTRTVFLGRMTRKQKEIYLTVKKAQARALRAVRPACRLRTLDRAARSIIEKAGYGRRFGHGLGHGVGLAVHESPVVSPEAEGQVERGMVFTVEPGIYVRGLGGVRIEDVVVVTRTGSEVLTRAPKEPVLQV